MDPHACRTRAFSLVELLIVMVITMVMLGLALTSFNRLTRASAVQAATRDVGSEIFSARQMSVTRRLNTAVIFPGEMGGGEAGIPPDALYTTYRTALVDGSNNFLEWNENTKWIYLPPGVSIMEADDDMGIQGGSPSAYQRTPEDNNITVVDGVDLSELGGGTTVDGVRAVVFSRRGRLVANNSLFITVGQAIYSPSNWDISKVEEDPEARNRSCLDQMTIEVSRFSGNIRYVPPENY